MSKSRMLNSVVDVATLVGVTLLALTILGGCRANASSWRGWVSLSRTGVVSTTHTSQRATRVIANDDKPKIDEIGGHRGMENPGHVTESGRAL
ncbi:MAG: hypothetical protein MI923_14895 [Phycisphaerales bacterium]|nr:hypothetical protein [Phycisphaerales bacterium]